MKTRFLIASLLVGLAPLHAQTAPATSSATASNTPTTSATTSNAAVPSAPTSNVPTSSAASFQANQPLTLSNALDVARGGSFTIGSAQARIAAAQARLQAAGAGPGTTLTLARAFGKNTGGFDEDILLSQVIELGKRGSRVRGAQLERDAAQFDRAGAGTDLEFAVRSAYYDALRTEVELNLANDSLQRAQTFSTAAQIQFTAGDVPRVNVVRSSIELSRAQAALTQAQSDRDTRLSILRSLFALPDAAPLQLGDKLSFQPKTYDLDVLQTLASSTRFDLLSARARTQSRQFAIAAARALNKPDAFVEARRAAISSYRDDTGTSIPNGSSLRVGIVIPLFDFGRNRGGVQEAKANAQEQQAILDETARTARLDVATTYARFVAAQAAVQGFTGGRLAQSRELLDMAQIGYQHGANSYLELLDAQTVYRNEQADYARALAAWNTALADLERAVGGKLP